MKKYLTILILLLTLLSSSCTTQKSVSIAETQDKIYILQKQILENTIWEIDSDIFNTLTLNDILPTQYSKIKLFENEIPYLKNNIELLDQQLHTAFNLSIFEYQKILIKYSNELDFTILYPDVNNEYIIGKSPIQTLYDTYGDEIKAEQLAILKTNFKDANYTYDQIVEYYNIYCNNLKLLNRPSLEPITEDINEKIVDIFFMKIENYLLDLENNNEFINTKINPNLINISN